MKNYQESRLFIEELERSHKKAIAEREFRTAKVLLYGAHNPQDVTRLEAQQLRALADILSYS